MKIFDNRKEMTSLSKLDPGMVVERDKKFYLIALLSTGKTLIDLTSGVPLFEGSVPELLSAQKVTGARLLIEEF